jgi:hypothetical protein
MRKINMYKVDISYSNTILIQTPTSRCKVVHYPPITNTSSVILRIYTLVVIAKKSMLNTKPFRHT